MKIAAIIQARMSSKRLPNKVMLPLSGKPVLEHVIERLKYSKIIEDIIVATSSDPSDQKIVDYCKKKKISFFCGNLTDVLDRYYQAAKKNNIDVVVRITSDCPLIDPEIVDEVLKNFFLNDYDLFSLGGEFPDGLDCQVFKFSALAKSWVEATLKSDREHVGTYIENTNPKVFKIGALKKFKNLQNYRWTIDQIEDYEFLKKIFRKLYKNGKIFLTGDIIELLNKEPELLNINKNITRNEGYLKSLEND